jgi:hypothetical protein
MNKETTAILGQTKKQSLTEALINVVIGYGISLLSLSIILPLMDIESSPGKNVQITLYFTAISILRSYTLRRYFNKAKRLNIKSMLGKFLKFMEGLAKDCPNETKW